MAFHCYLTEGVDTAVIECGIGGEYDSTNVLVKPSVTAVTSLSIDHTAMLGDTIDSIAWHKSGIFKDGVPAFSAPQPEVAVEVLRRRAGERQTSLQVVSRLPALDFVTLGLAADFQQVNASLAVAVAAQHLINAGVGDIPDDITACKTLPDSFREGLQQVNLRGRCETRPDVSSNLTWYIDGGHTLESIEMAGRWFASLISPKSGSPAGKASIRILIFNQQTRDAGALARKLHDTLAKALDQGQPFTNVIFCTNTTYAETGFRPDLTSINTNAADVEALSVQNALAATWKEIDSAAEVKVERTIDRAISSARRVAAEAQSQHGDNVKVLVTGSLHLVGGVIEVLESEMEKAKAETKGAQ